jgi:hypothetical protein
MDILHIGLITGTIGVIGTFLGVIKWLVNHYLRELKPNGGSSLRDQVNRLEHRVDEIFVILAELNSRRRH